MKLSFGYKSSDLENFPTFTFISQKQSIIHKNAVVIGYLALLTQYLFLSFISLFNVIENKHHSFIDHNNFIQIHKTR